MFVRQYGHCFVPQEEHSKTFMLQMRHRHAGQRRKHTQQRNMWSWSDYLQGTGDGDYTSLDICVCIVTQFEHQGTLLPTSGICDVTDCHTAHDISGTSCSYVVPSHDDPMASIESKFWCLAPREDKQALMLRGRTTRIAHDILSCVRIHCIRSTFARWLLLLPHHGMLSSPHAYSKLGPCEMAGVILVSLSLNLLYIYTRPVIVTSSACTSIVTLQSSRKRIVQWRSRQ